MSSNKTLEQLVFSHPVVKDVLKELVYRVKESEENNLLKIILFGSMARGDFNEESDTDVFILLKEGNLSQKRLEISDICTDVSYDMAFKNKDNLQQWYVLLSPIVETVTNLQQKIKGVPRRKAEPIFDVIQKEGVSLFGA